MPYIVFFVLLLIVGLVAYGFGKTLVIGAAVCVGAALAIGGIFVIAATVAAFFRSAPKPESPGAKNPPKHAFDVIGIDIPDSAPPDALPANVEMVAGRFLKRDDGNVALLADELATKIETTIGDYLTISGQLLHVVGIFHLRDRTAYPAPDNLVLVTLPTLKKWDGLKENGEALARKALNKGAEVPDGATSIGHGKMETSEGNIGSATDDELKRLRRMAGLE